ncbi:MAG: Gfo/Idh/MocA family oxidoreductase [Bryobacterales bacterium]|nr:Gfo/Idh/MocA family oxidoreductase [Bryobacterales bacterium]
MAAAQPVRWGVLGVAKIATKKVIPAMQQSTLTPVMAIASRQLPKAQEAAAALGIPKAYGSYEDLLADPDIDAIYNPLPNHLHVPWSIRAAEAGKHVLCEKPLGLSSREVSQLIAVRDRTGVCIGEAFMVHTHPQWLRVRDLIRGGRIGALRSVFGYFSYFLSDPANVRCVPQWGGGALMDIGCYPVHCSRFIFGEEPRRVVGLVEKHPQWNVDILTSAMLDYPSGQCIFTCGMQVVPYQRMQFYGTKGRIEIEIPFNAPPDRPCLIQVDDGGDLSGSTITTESIPVCDQYTVQGAAFSRAVRGLEPVPVSLEDSMRNMCVLEAIFSSAAAGTWVNLPAAS